MKFGVLVTQGGPHPADRWAEVSAAQIADLIVVDQASASPEAVAARKAKPRFELDLADALEGHHKAVQDHELGKLNEHAAERYAHSLNPAEHMPETIDEALAAVTEAAAGTPFEAGFATPETQAVVRRILATNFSSVMHVERSWHADRQGKPLATFAKEA